MTSHLLPGPGVSSVNDGLPRCRFSLRCCDERRGFSCWSTFWPVDTAGPLCRSVNGHRPSPPASSRSARVGGDYVSMILFPSVGCLGLRLGREWVNCVEGHADREGNIFKSFAFCNLKFVEYLTSLAFVSRMRDL